MNSKRRAVRLTAVAVVLSATVNAQSSSVSVTAAGSASYPAGTTYNGAVLTGLQAGFGVEIAGDGSAAGAFDATLVGPSATFVIQGKVTGGKGAAAGSATFSGTCTVDAGGGAAPVSNVPFVATATPDGGTKGTIALTLGASALP